MQTKFLHFSDCHLGYRQYNQKERFNDFARAFLSIVDAAITADVDFTVLAGDLFQKRAIDALTLNQAMTGLERLKQAKIPCIAVEGNHEQAYYNQTIGWMEFLAQRDLLILLDTQFQEEVAQLRPYKNYRGAYYDPVPGLRIYGLRYMGSSTAKAVEAYAAALAAQPADGVEYTIFAAHTGVEGVLPNYAGGLSHRQLAPLRPYVDYLALGHVHKPFQFDDWIYNAGSPETCSMEEVSWPERGYYLVEVDTDPGADDVPKHTATLHANPRRPFYRLQMKVDLCNSPQRLYQRCQELIARKARDVRANSAPVVELRLTGVLPFDRSALDLEELEKMVEEVFSPLTCHIKNVSVPTEYAIDTEEQLSRKELERQIVTELLGRDARFREESDAWAALLLNLKQMALTGSPPEAILAELAARTTQAAPSQEH